MKKIFIFLILSIINMNAIVACDVCGCSIGGNYFGILPLYNKNFVGLRWSQAKFYAFMNHQSEHLGPEHSNDTYSKLELWGRYYINKKIQVYAFIPFNYNSMDGSEQIVSTHGLGDITIMGNYLLFNTGEDKTSKFKHTWSAGVGVKVPTGTFDLEDNGKLVNPNFQLGTGSTDFIVSSIYTLRYQKMGVNVETGYKINTRNGNEYLFGNQFHFSSQLFFWQNIKSFSFLPNVGLYYERGQMHKDGDIIQVNTGGSALFASAGLETYFKVFTVGVNYKCPLNQQYKSDNIADITGEDRWSISLTYSF